MLTRRAVLLSSAAVMGVAGLSAVRRTSFAQAVTAETEEEAFEVTMTEEEWRQILTDAQFAVLRQRRTEAPYTNALLGERSPLLDEHREGLFHCAGCDLPVYSSEHKYDSGTGWPSFWQPYDENNIRTRDDYEIGSRRTEVHCRRCGGHFGHIFEDGPPPTGLRHCLNGLALIFVPADGSPRVEPVPAN